MSSRIPKSPKASHMHRGQLEKTINILKEEIRRLHGELTQLKNELKLDKTRGMDLSLALEEKEKEISQQQKDYDQEMNGIISKLLLLESDFRKEQKEIQSTVEERNNLLEELSGELDKRDVLIKNQEKKFEALKAQHDKELKARDKRIATQWREIESLKSANAKFIDALSPLRLVTDGQVQLKSASCSSVSLTKTRRTAESVHVKPRMAVSPNTTRRKFSNNPEWKEELSAFF